MYPEYAQVLLFDSWFLYLINYHFCGNAFWSPLKGKNSKWIYTFLYAGTKEPEH